MATDTAPNSWGVRRASLLLLAVCVLPMVFIGLWIARHLTQRLSREAFVHLVTWLVLVSGLALIWRYLSN